MRGFCSHGIKPATHLSHIVGKIGHLQFLPYITGYIIYRAVSHNNTRSHGFALVGVKIIQHSPGNSQSSGMKVNLTLRKIKAYSVNV